MPGTSEADRPFFSGLRRWLRGSCLSRIPLLRGFFRPSKPQPAPKPLLRSTALGGYFLEDRNVPDYIYALAQTALLGEAALYVAASLRTPEQVFLHGWGDTSDEFSVPPTDRPATPFRADFADTAFINLTVTPSPEDRTPPQEQEPATPTQPAPADAQVQYDGQEPTQFITADEALAPVIDQDFLDRVGRVLSDGLPADGGGQASPVASPGDFTRSEPTGLGDGGSFGMGLGGADGVAPPANVGAGPSFGTDFDPFLSTGLGQGGGSSAAAAGTETGTSNATALGGPGTCTANGADGTCAGADSSSSFAPGAQ